MNNFQPNRPGGYLIRLKANPDLVLACVNGKAALAWRNIDDPSQLWAISPLTGTDNYQLTNVVGGKMKVSAYGDGLVFGVDSKGWNIPGKIDSTDFLAIRPADNFDWNLNALGNGPYDVGSRVGVWDWSAGAGNEMWQITYFPANPTMTDWKVVGNQSRGLAVQENDLNGILPLICDGQASYPQKIERLVFAQINWTNGFALRSKFNGKYVFWKGPGQPLGQSDTMTIRALWTFAGGRPDGYGAIRPALDSDQNFNVLGNPTIVKGATVGTWTWDGGASNELWTIFQAYA